MVGLLPSTILLAGRLFEKEISATKWSVVWRPKDQGGLGVHDLEVTNKALLGKCLYKLLYQEGVWQTILKRKYVGSSAISHVYWKHGDSHFWAGLMVSKKYFFPYGTFSIKVGSEIRFWKDKWLGMPHSVNNIHLYTILCDTRVILWPWFWDHPHPMSHSEEILLDPTCILG
jgi:hypothetical protein